MLIFLKSYIMYYIFIFVLLYYLKKKYVVLNIKIKFLFENGCFGYIFEFVEMIFLVCCV